MNARVLLDLPQASGVLFMCILQIHELNMKMFYKLENSDVQFSNSVTAEYLFLGLYVIL